MCVQRKNFLTELGISDPADIELTAIARCVGVEVQHRRLRIVKHRSSALKIVQ